MNQDTRRLYDLDELRAAEKEVSQAVDRLEEDDGNYVPSQGDKDGNAMAFWAEHHLTRTLTEIQAAIERYEEMEQIEKLYDD